MHRDIRVRREPIVVPLDVWMDTPSPLLRETMKLPKNKKVLAVREPKSSEQGYIHYLTRVRKSPRQEISDRQATIDAIVAQYGMTPREVLKALAADRHFALDYQTKLPFLDPNRGQLSKYVVVSK